jgi:Arc/MetJ-type ribon-helix-helix transcriptional regulator
MVRTQIQLTEKQAEEIRRIAKTRHFSVAEVIREAVNHVIKSIPAVSMEERRRRALSAVGKFTSGKRNISRKHDKYLSEAFRK